MALGILLPLITADLNSSCHTGLPLPLYPIHPSKSRNAMLFSRASFSSINSQPSLGPVLDSDPFLLLGSTPPDAQGLESRCLAE